MNEQDRKNAHNNLRFIAWLPIDVLPLLRAINDPAGEGEFLARLVRRVAEKRGITALPYDEWIKEQMLKGGSHGRGGGSAPPLRRGKGKGKGRGRKTEIAPEPVKRERVRLDAAPKARVRLDE